MNQEKEESFFKKLIISIKNFEKYPELASKKWGMVVSYLLKLLLLFVILASFATTYQIGKKIKDGLDYIKSEFPEFAFENGRLTVEAEEPIIKKNKDTLIDTIIIDASELEEQALEDYKESLQQAENGILLIKDKVFIKTQVTKGIIEYSYSSIFTMYQMQEINKQELLQYFSGTNLILIDIGIFIMLLIYLFLIYITSIWIDILLLAAFGYITALLMKLRLRFSAMCKIAIHSLTLPILLNAVAILLETFTGFTIKYFEIMYIGISYIYIITAILMIKSDIMKNQQELAKIIEEQEKIRQELDRKKEEEERQKEEKEREKEKEQQRKKEKKENEEKNNGNEPQGENA